MKAKESRGLERMTETRVVYRGINQAARRLGVSRGHLSFVMHGTRRPGKELARKLSKMGIECGTDSK